MKKLFLASLLGLLAQAAVALDAEADRYVRLALELTHYDRDYVDAFLGPEAWTEQAKNSLRSKEALTAAISDLYADLQDYSPSDNESVARYRALLRNVRAMDTRMRMVNGETFSFAEEARLIYDVELPVYDLSEFDEALQEIDALIPGEGDLAERVDAFRNRLVIQPEDRDEIMRTAIDECRRRSGAFIRLPDTERFTLEYVTEKSWSGYNWYQGDNESLMQINIDFPTKIDSPVRLGCHEGYPGHHVWNVLVENVLYKGNGWIEYSLIPLFSPTGVIAEGSANYGVELAFPGNERMEYERDVLYPMAGLDPAEAAVLSRLKALTAKLDTSQIATAQLYLDGEISREEAIEQRRKYSLTSRARAEQSVRFIEQYRSYVLNYTLGKQIVADYIESQGDDSASRWAAFERLLTELSFASDMIGD